MKNNLDYSTKSSTIPSVFTCVYRFFLRFVCCTLQTGYTVVLNDFRVLISSHYNRVPVHVSNRIKKKMNSQFLFLTRIQLKTILTPVKFRHPPYEISVLVT